MESLIGADLVGVEFHRICGKLRINNKMKFEEINTQYQTKGTLGTGLPLHHTAALIEDALRAVCRGMKHCLVSVVQEDGDGVWHITAYFIICRGKSFSSFLHILHCNEAERYIY